ncbi:rhodanese-like domain-containing protein [Staphylococcus aureus]|uniref:rhodanese-like domain-containing protein n=1 Tax=Staphylococcus aureus TaxID=1280 RepID=UPI0008DAE6D0|nr:rhodanese-like domain-containing protein [Staphylococcus aureus]MBU6939899.1 rhodanese-like domain-containing protein [Staphylococcus aureus]MBU6946448.1 rhodanese-like domain-containing protein [Staphylococcus aureus]MBY0861512.1 rhodanese-like domain-containing protein [Staphylococcus aureus]MCS5100778.1 rhodanese-like domain-containing protein [Staphylococcus aureus]MDG6542856.1 rhodanese-like domain-containing protein [Staphylococcus aureus]
MKSITTDELKNKLLESKPVQIVDVRTDEETAMGYIPNVKLIPMDTIPDNLNSFNKNEIYYIVCAGGVRSAKVVEYLEANGIDAVNVEGGMHAWGDEGLEIKSI